MARIVPFAARIVFVACAALTAWSAFGPPDVAQPRLFPWDKAQHFCAYFALTASGIVAFQRTSLLSLALLLGLSGVAIELVQALPFMGRDAQASDWIADIAGIGAVMGSIAAFRMRGRALKSRS